jgi:hypothetical protein
MNYGTNDGVDEYAALGRFIAQSSVLEMCLHACLKHLLRIPGETARLLVGEPRIGDLVELTKKSAVMQGMSGEQLSLLTLLLTECNNGNKVRQVVAHKPFFMEGSVLVFHNKVSARSQAAIFEYRCSIEELNNLALLTRLVAQELLGVVIADNPPSLLDKARQNVASLKKLPLPKTPGQPPPPKLPKQKRRPQPSGK